MATPKKPITKENLFKKTSQVIRACEELETKKTSVLKTLANDYAVIYDDINDMSDDKSLIVEAIKKGFSSEEQAILALSIDSAEFAKQEIKDKRKSIQSKASGYFPRLVKYTFPEEWEKVQEQKARDKAKAKAEDSADSAESEESSTPMLDLTSKSNLAQFLNSVISTVNCTETVDYNRNAVTTALQQIIKALI